MTAYAIAIIRETRFCTEVKEYLQKIDDTLAPFAGKYRVHGGPYESLEGAWANDLVVIEFPDLTNARRWYESPAYRAIQPLRTGNSEGDVFLVQGVPDNHKGIDLLG